MLSVRDIGKASKSPHMPGREATDRARTSRHGLAPVEWNRRTMLSQRTAANAPLLVAGRRATFTDNASDFTGRIAVSLQVPSHPQLVPVIVHDVRKQPVVSFSRP